MATEQKLKPYQIVKREDVMTGYQKIMTDINHCINLFDELDKRRNFSQWVSDWAVGERKAIDFKNVLSKLKRIQSVLDEGTETYTDLFAKLKRFEMMDNEFQQKIEDSRDSTTINLELVKHHNSLMEEVNNDYIDLNNAVVEFKKTGVFDKKDLERDFTSLVKSGAQGAAIGGVVGGVLGGAGSAAAGGIMALAAGGALGTGGTAALTAATGALGALGITGATALGITGVVTTGGTILLAAGGLAVVAGIISCVAYSYAHHKGKERGLKYKELKFLCDSLNDNKLLAAFQAHHTIISKISSGIDNTLKDCKTHFQQIIQDTQENFKQAREIYDKTLRENLQMLKESEPDMDEAMINRMAANMAKTACKTFLKEKLGYNDSRVDEVLGKVQK